MSDLAKSPPFLFTYWNPFSADSSFWHSWFDYVKDVSLSRYTADSVGVYLKQISAEQIDAIHATGNKICGVFYERMSALQSQLGDVQEQLGNIQGQLNGVQRQLYQATEQIYHVHAELREVNQRLTLLLDEAKISNILQQNIAELLRIPDSQRQRQHHIELGLKFLKNALRDEDLYQDALCELLEAEKLMHADYFVLHRIGLIYLYVPALGNLEKALEYFSRAAKYAFVESDPDAARLSNVLNKNVHKRFADQGEPSLSDISALAAESYQEAGTALYAMGRFNEAVKMVEKAVKCQPMEGKYHFYLAKYLVRLGKFDPAAQRLQKAIELIPQLALATIGDFDLNRSQPVLDLLEILDNNVNAQLLGEIQRLEQWCEANSESSDTDVPKWLTTAKGCLQTGSYPQKKELLELATNYEEMLTILPAHSRVMSSFSNTFIGQERFKTHLAVALKDAMFAQKPLRHMLLLGPPGFGKITLAHSLANAMGVNIKTTSGIALATVGDFAGLLSRLKSGDVLFIDKFDRLQPSFEELLATAMENFAIDYCFDQDFEERHVRLGLSKFTLIGAAPSADQIPSERLSLFSMIEYLEPYNHDEQILLASHLGSELGIKPELATKCMGDRNNATPKEIYRSLLQLKVDAEPYSEE